MKKTMILLQVVGILGLCALLSSCGMTILEPANLDLEEQGQEHYSADPASWGSGEPIMVDGTVPGHDPPPPRDKPKSWSDHNTFDSQDDAPFRRAAAQAERVYSTKQSVKFVYPVRSDYYGPDHDSIMWRLRNIRLEAEKEDQGGGMTEYPEPPCLK